MQVFPGALLNPFALQSYTLDGQKRPLKSYDNSLHRIDAAAGLDRIFQLIFDR